MPSSTPADQTDDTPRRYRRVLQRYLLLGVTMFLAGCAGRVTHVVESFTFYVPSREPFVTPAVARDITITTAGRATLHGWWLNAHEGVPAKGTILFCHGNAGRLPDHLAFVERFPALGYDVLMFDYRGYGRSSRTVQLNRYSLLRDARAMHDYLLKTGTDPDLPLVLLGHSMGAAIGVALAAERPDAFDGVVLVAPFSSFPRVASDFAGLLGWLLIPQGLAPENQAASLGKTPLLLIHGEQDRVVRPYHSDRIADAAVQAGVPTTHLPIRDATHVDVFDAKYGTHQTIDRFIGSLLRPDAAATTTEDPAPAE
ncbi:MAG: alpha/beta fold hydrolase [Planctomycetota bacterium]